MSDVEGGGKREVNPELRAALVTLQDRYGTGEVLKALAAIAEDKRGVPRSAVARMARWWTCPYCGSGNKVDHEVDDLSNVECPVCERVSLIRVVQ